jgi:hypothetical protein
LSPRGRATATATASSSASEKARKGKLVRLFNYTWTPAAELQSRPPGRWSSSLPPHSIQEGQKGKGRKTQLPPPAPTQPISRPVHLPVRCIVPLTAKSGHYDLITPPNADTTSRTTPGAARRINSRPLSRGIFAGEIRIDSRIIIFWQVNLMAPGLIVSTVLTSLGLAGLTRLANAAPMANHV